MSKKREYFFLFFIFAASFLFRLYQLGSQSYWNDEFVSIYFSTRDSWSTITWDNHPFLYHFLLKIWIYFLGPYETATRLLSAILSAIASVVLFGSLKKYFGLKSAALATATQILSPLSIEFAQESRMYALLELAATIQMHYFIGYLYKGKKCFHWLAVSTLFMTITHYISYLIISIQLIFIFRNRIKSAVQIWILALLTLILGMVLAYARNFSWVHLEWQKLRFQLNPSSLFPTEVIQSLLLASPFGVVLFMSVTFVASVFLFRLHKKEDYSLLNNSFIKILSVIIIIFLMSALTQRSLFLPRYFTFLIPWCALTFASALNYFATYRSKTIFAVISISTILTLAGSLPKAYENRKSGYRDAFKLIVQNPDTFVFTTRSLAFKTPYLEDKGILVEKYEYNKDGYHYLQDQLKKHSVVWFLETPIGSVTYYEPLKARLRADSIIFEQFKIEKQNAEPLLLLKIKGLSSGE